MLGVIILNWNAAADTLACLGSVLAWETLTPRVWVVDNASSGDDVAQIRAAFPAVSMIQNDNNAGFAGGNNAGIAVALDAGCEEILLLNNDATITEEDVLRLQAVLRMQPHIGIVGPALWDADRPDTLLSAGGKDIATHIVSHNYTLPDQAEYLETDYVPGTCVLFRAALFRTIGLLDEAYFFGGEVADFCARARPAGFISVIAPQARAYHRLARSSTSREQFHIYYVLRNRFLYVRKFYPRRRWNLFALWVGYGLYVTALAMMQRKRWRARAALLGVLDGVRGRYGGQNARILGRQGKA